MSKDLEFVHKYRRGEIAMGKPWGAEAIDKYWLFKPNFTVVLGIAGAGKTTLLVYLNLVQAIRQKKKCMVWSSENSKGILNIMCINALLGTDLKGVSAEAVTDAYDKVQKYMDFVDTEKVATMYTIIEALERKLDDGYHAVIIDPFSSLKMDDRYSKFKSEYKYNYESITDLRAFQKRSGMAVYLCVHPNTSKSREKHDKDHPFAGMTKPLQSSDAENGSMFDNRADDYIICHRYKYDEEDRAYTRIYVAKIKEDITGGRETPLEYPIMAKKENYRFTFDGVDILQDAMNHSDEFKNEIPF